MPHSKPETLPQLLADSWPMDQWRDLSIVLAVSGGPDSVALLRAMEDLKSVASGAGKVIVGHFNHRLRPEANDDAKFVGNLAGQFNLTFETGDADVASLATERGDGIEAAAREARYAFLLQTAQLHGARYVVTGHTANDQVETVLFNILRGTGLAGLAGMQRARPLSPAVTLLRPLLSVRRSAVLDYLAEIDQPYRTDPSNKCSDFARNRIRNELLPLLREKYNPEVETALARLAKLAGDAQQVIEHNAEELLDRCLIRGPETQADVAAGSGTAARLSLTPMASAERHIIREMFVALWRRLGWQLQNMGFCQWEQLADMAATATFVNSEHPSGDISISRSFPGNVTVQRLENEMILARRI